jgi:hypothetical protein
VTRQFDGIDAEGWIASLASANTLWHAAQRRKVNTGKNVTKCTKNLLQSTDALNLAQSTRTEADHAERKVKNAAIRALKKAQEKHRICLALRDTAAAQFLEAEGEWMAAAENRERAQASYDAFAPRTGAPARSEIESGML